MRGRALPAFSSSRRLDSGNSCRRVDKSWREEVTSQLHTPPDRCRLSRRLASTEMPTLTRAEALKVLEVSEGADVTTVRTAWKKQALIHHPDKNGKN